MKLQVLVAALKQRNIEELLDDMNISTEAIIANQTDNFSYQNLQYRNKDIKVYNFAERGVGLNRNNALMRADADIVLIADEDIEYVDNYEEIVLQEFEKQKDVDVIVFNIEEKITNNYVIKKRKKIHRYNCLRYGAVRMALRLDRIKQKNLYFSLLFGGGTQYGSGEDSIYIYNCIKSGLKVYSSPETILKLRPSESTWFQGYNEKYYYDKGALMSCIFNKISFIMMPIFFLKNYKTTKSIGGKKAYKMMRKGCVEFTNGKKYENK